jgi:rhomboid protease GluP
VTVEAAAGMPATAHVTWTLIALTAVVSSLGLMFDHAEVPRSAVFGPAVAGGQWWRLITAMFFHNSPGHFAWNTIPLALFGSRLERIVGRWTFLAFYLACGVAGALSSLFFTPEWSSVGASGAVIGVCAGLFVHYAARFRGLSRIQRTRLAALGIYTGYSVWSGLFTPRVDSGCHLGGLAAGVILGWLLTGCPGVTMAGRRRVLIATGLLYVLFAWSFRQSHLYLVHLNAAARAMQGGNAEVATRELRTGLAMKPDSSLGHFLEEKLDQLQSQPDASGRRSHP